MIFYIIHIYSLAQHNGFGFENNKQYLIIYTYILIVCMHVCMYLYMRMWKCEELKLVYVANIFLNYFITNNKIIIHDDKLNNNNKHK